METGEKLATEHALRILPSNAALWVQTQKPQTLKQVSRITDQYLRDRNLDYSILRKQKRWMPYQHPSYADGKRPVRPQVDKPNSGTETGKGTVSPTQTTSKCLNDTGCKHYLAKYFDKAKGPFCFGCKDWGHIAAHCLFLLVSQCTTIVTTTSSKANLMESMPSSSSTQLHHIHLFLANLQGSIDRRKYLPGMG